MLLKKIIPFIGLVYSSSVFYIVFIHGERHRFVQRSDRINVVPAINLLRFYRTNPHQTNLYITLLSEVFGNILLFVPFGFLIKCIYPKKRSQTVILYGLLLSVGIELTQLFLQIGICDIDDVILNTSGVAVGVLAYNKIMRSSRMQMLIK